VQPEPDTNVVHWIEETDESVAERWGALSAIAAANGKPMPVIDGLLAATAVHHDLMLVTRNGQDVAGTAVPTLNPWS